MSRNPPLTDIGKVYKQLEDFKSKISLILHQKGHSKEIVELNKYYDKIIDVKRVNVRKPIELLYEYGIKQYAEKILTRDEKFFLGEDTEGTTEEKLKASIDTHDFVFISQIRNMWHTLPPTTKESIWDYVQVICLLAEKVTGNDVLSTTRERLKIEGRIK